MPAWSWRSLGAGLLSLISGSVKCTVCAVALYMLAPQFAPTPAAAKTPGAVHCFGGWCHRVNTFDEMDSMVGRRGLLVASYYDDCRRDRFNTCGLTSSGAVFRPDLADNAASPIFPDGTVLLAFNPTTKLAAVVRVTNAGPYRGDRKLDVSRATAARLGFLKRGVTELEVVVLRSPDLHEARYSKRRTYPPVPGFLGRFAAIDDAHDAAVAQLSMEATAVCVAAADAPSEGSDGELSNGRIRIKTSTAVLVEQSLITTAPDALAAPLPEVVSVTGYQDGITMVPVTEVRSTGGALSSLASRFSDLIAAARSAAQLPRTQSAPLQLAVLPNDAGRSLLHRARDFIHAAQARARLGASASATYSDFAALSQPSS